MKSLLFLLLSAFSINNAFAHEPKVSSIGEYSNMLYTHDEDPHFLSGFSIRLYSLNNEVIGEIAMANGSPEPVSGMLYDVIYKPKQDFLAFKAKLSLGNETNPDIKGKDRDSRDFFAFSGKITPNVITGAMIQKDGYDLSKRGLTTKVKLKRFEKNNTLDIDLDDWNRLKNIPPVW